MGAPLDLKGNIKPFKLKLHWHCNCISEVDLPGILLNQKWPSRFKFKLSLDCAFKYVAASSQKHFFSWQMYFWWKINTLTNCNIGLLTALRDKMFIRISPDIWLHGAINQHFTSIPPFLCKATVTAPPPSVETHKFVLLFKLTPPTDGRTHMKEAILWSTSWRC